MNSTSIVVKWVSRRSESNRSENSHGPRQHRSVTVQGRRCREHQYRRDDSDLPWLGGRAKTLEGLLVQMG
jgi:hypothetical protein